ALEELHGQVGYAVIFSDLVNGYDVIVLDGGGGLRFTQETLPCRLPAGQGGKHRLESDGPFELRIFGLKDDAHATAAQQFENTVRPQPSDLVRLLRLGQEGQSRVR